MRLNVLNTRQFITKELGVRYLHRIGLEIMLWRWHLQIVRR